MPTTMSRAQILVALLAISSVLGAQSVDTTLVKPVLNAVRTMHPPKIDGRLDEAEWGGAPVATRFTQRYPDPGLLATYQTEVRILYDNDAIYVGAQMFDPHPDSIAAPLARRDPGDVSSDWFDVIFDSYHDRRTGYRFAVNPAGTKIDVYHFNDGDDDQSWDAFWDVATRVDSLGWTAEYRIPLSQLRFHGASGEQTWGLNFYRAVARRDEWTFWSPYPPTAPGFVSAFGELRGLVGLTPASPVEVQPYVSSRVRTGGDLSDSPFHRAAHSTASVGADLRVGLGSGLSLSATVNPDFGQVEVDPAVINLTTVETFFPEKRPFFLEGSGIFDFGTLPYFASYGSSKFVHWRRIGRAPQLSPSAMWVDSPEPASILGASKLSGQLGSGWSVGVLDAVTGRETVRIADSARVFGRAVVEPLTNYFVARLKRDFDDGRSTLGFLATTTGRSLDVSTDDVLRADATIAGVDATHYTSNRHWLFGGSLVSSRVDGSQAAIAATQQSSVRYYGRPDASYLPFDPTRRDLTGYSASAGAVYQGNPWFGSLEAKEMSPGFESNDLGYLPRADVRSLAGAIGAQHNSSRGNFREARITAYALDAWNFGGSEIYRDFGLNGYLRFPNFWRISARGDVYPSVFDDRLTRGGPTPRVPARQRGSLSFDSDSRRMILGSASMQVERKAFGGFDRLTSAAITFRPKPSVQVSVGPSLDVLRDESQFVRAVPDLQASTYSMRYVFATLDQHTLSADLRIDWTFTPDLSLQLYAQPFRARAEFTGYKELRTGQALGYDVYGRDVGTVQRIGDAQVAIDPDGAGAAPSFIVGGSPDESSFLSHSRRINAVLRREFRNGAVIYLVWQQTDDRTRPTDIGASSSLWTAVPSTNVLLAKFAYRFAR
ncbi:MAG TPA: DUF5916 domain-containing protein [Gemmatimonadaceae bacterium]|jgi:hypothetical protein